jgi:hypothetical protein
LNRDGTATPLKPAGVSDCSVSTALTCNWPVGGFDAFVRKKFWDSGRAIYWRS